MVRFRSSPIPAPDAIELRLFLNAHHKGSLPLQLKVVWDLLLQADPEGPVLIFCAALHFEQLYTTQPRIRGTLTACTLAGSPKATPYIGGFSYFVTSIAAPIASGRSDLAGWDFHPLEKRRLITAHTPCSHLIQIYEWQQTRKMPTVDSNKPTATHFCIHGVIEPLL